MSKELTEKWKNGTLEDGYYYVKNKHFLGGETEYYHVFPSGVKYWGGCDDEDIEEILAPVPSYDQFVELVTKCHRLEKQLDIAVNTLEVIERKSDKFDNNLGFIEQLDYIKADCQATLYYLKEIDEVLK